DDLVTGVQTCALPICNLQGTGFTQDLSARGALLYTDLMPSEGEEIELTLIMPSEITLAENMPVCCRGKVVRVTRLESKYAVAVRSEERRVGKGGGSGW